MFSSQIARALNKDEFVSEYFGGVFPSDKLPLHVKYPSAFVANTDPASEKGEHWVCYFFDKTKNLKYFDSFGLPPLNCELEEFANKNCKSSIFNDVQLQGGDSDSCGHYCIAMLINLARDEPFGEIIKRFKGKVPGEYDEHIAFLVNKRYNINNNKSKEGGDEKEHSGSGYYFPEQCSYFPS